jgi:RNA polymerase sigma factor (TIGR02999 family)
VSIGVIPSPPIMNEVTQILSAIEQGDPRAAEQLLPLVYAELRKLAAQKLAHEKPGQTLDATGLVHEAYLRLVANGEGAASSERQWDSRRHFFAAAAEAMRRILIEQARRKGRRRHGGGLRRVDLVEEEVADMASCNEHVLLLDDALTRLARIRPQAAELVKLRFFSGLTIEETAPLIGIAPRTARRLWVFARAWLRCEMDRLVGPGS